MGIATWRQRPEVGNACPRHARQGVHTACVLWGEQVELGRLVLKRFLLLALLLDRTVTGSAPCLKGTPLLFRRGQPIKSSVQVGALRALDAVSVPPITGKPIIRRACMLLRSKLFSGV